VKPRVQFPELQKEKKIINKYDSMPEGTKLVAFTSIVVLGLYNMLNFMFLFPLKNNSLSSVFQIR
jgi:hypothetical protein